MGRREKFTKEFLISESINYIRKHEISTISAREITKNIGCSTQIIFKYYKTMQEFKDDLIKAIAQEFESFCQKLNNNQNDLFANTFSYLIFAKKENNLFKALFINKDTTINYFPTSIEDIADKYKVTTKTATIYQDLLLYIHGIACLLCIDKITIKDIDLYNLIKKKVQEIEK